MILSWAVGIDNVKKPWQTRKEKPMQNQEHENNGKWNDRTLEVNYVKGIKS